MSILDSERVAVKSVINFNPSTITVKRPATTTNSRGVEVINWASTSDIPITNAVRVVSSAKPFSKIQADEGKYSNDKVYWIIADWETVIQKYDRFTWYNKTFEIQDVEPITIDGGIKNYQAELKEYTQGNA